MKDYLLNCDDSRRNILSYKIKNGEIVAKLASGELYTIPYSDENENTIISRMEEQARKSQIMPLKKAEKNFSILMPLIILPLSVINFLNYGGWFFATVLTTVSVTAIIYPMKMILKVIKNRELNKMKYFLKYKDELNEIIKKNNNMELGVSKKAIEQIKLQINKEKEPLNINNIDKYSLNDLMKLRNDTGGISSFEFNEDEYTFISDKPLVIRDLTQYRQELKKGSANFDFSQLDVSGEDIQFINLENLNLDINLREVFVPFGGRAKWGNNFLEPLFSFSHFGGDDFLNIKDSKLSGNNITGDLTPFKDNLYYKPVYFYYSEETFDDNYKLKYPQFFISKDAPLDLREKYYNPKNCILEIDHRKYNAFVRQTLTFDEYLKYYNYLKGKYLGNFSIGEQDLKQIKIIEKYGLKEGKVFFNEGDVVLDHINGINQTGKFEACGKNIYGKDDSSVLSLKLRRKDHKKGANT